MSQLEKTGKLCPACSYGEVVKRTNRRLGTQFLGCSTFPGCSWTYSPRDHTDSTTCYIGRMGFDPSLEQALTGFQEFKQNTALAVRYNDGMLPTGKPHVSYSEISDWYECSFRHKLKHVDKINLSRPSPNLTFGSATHAVAENFLNTKTIDLEIAKKIIDADIEKYKEEESFKDLDVEKLMESIGKIMTDLPTFLNETFPNWEFVRAEEDLYEDMKQFFEAHEGVSFKGFIDCIIKVPTKKEGEFLYWIIDWKTANRPWTLDKIKDSRVRMQLVFYKKFWATKHNIPLKQIRCGFVTLLKSGKPGKLCKLITISVGEKSADKSLLVLNNSITSIKRGTALKNRNACKWCDYKNTEHCT